MGVKVRMKPMDLMDQGDTVHYASGHHWTILEDYTLEIFDEDEDTVAHIHKDRWDAVSVTKPKADV